MRFPAAFLLLFCLLAGGACRARPPVSSEVFEPAAPPAEQWLSLRNGRLEEGPPPGGEDGLAREPAAFLPWTVQARVADLVSWNGAVYLALNGQGLVRLEWGSPPRLTAVPAAPDGGSHIFPGRTITALLPGDGELLCHLYFNNLLNVTAAERLKVQGISLLRLRPAVESLEVLAVPSQQAEPHWEAVGLLAAGDSVGGDGTSGDGTGTGSGTVAGSGGSVGGGSVATGGPWLLFEWKTTGAGPVPGGRETRFRYSAFHPGSGREAPLSREAYQRAYGFRDIEDPSIPAGLQAFLREVHRQTVPADDRRTALQLILREPGSPGELRFERRPPGYLQAADPRLETVHLYRDPTHLYALLPGGTLLKADRAGGRPQRLSLPALPPGYRYGRFLAAGSRVAAAWEQVRFFEVGAAGLLIRDFSR